MSKINYIYADTFSASWKLNRKSMMKLTKFDLLELIDIVLDNSYFRFGKKVYQQISGIPMGTDSGPFLANLTLFSMEFKYLSKEMKRGNFTVTRFLNHTFRYIDDITIVNDDGLFERIYHEIYPDSLTLKKVNRNNREAEVLDIHTKISNGKFVSRVFDKRETFAFKCNCFPNIHTNISETAIYNCFFNELIRYARICSDTKILVEQILYLKYKLIDLGYVHDKLAAKLRKFVKRKDPAMNKFDLTYLKYEIGMY
jgi:hypothetical protein